jgi:hypothetical protein
MILFCLRAWAPSIQAAKVLEKQQKDLLVWERCKKINADCVKAHGGLSPLLVLVRDQFLLSGVTPTTSRGGGKDGNADL